MIESIHEGKKRRGKLKNYHHFLSFLGFFFLGYFIIFRSLDCYFFSFSQLHKFLTKTQAQELGPFNMYFLEPRVCSILINLVLHKDKNPILTRLLLKAWQYLPGAPDQLLTP